MAKIVANIPIDPEDLDFEQFSGGVFSNSDATQSTEFQVDALAGGFPITITVTGEGFQYADIPGRGEVPFSGVIDSISVSTPFGDAFSLTGITRDADDEAGKFELTVKKLLKVADSASPADNLDLISKILKGDDELIGSDGGDVLAGFAGDDTIVGNDGGDAIDGGSGKDTVTYADSGAVTINLANPGAGSGDAQGDSLIGVEFIIGSAKKDIFIGSDGDDRFDGGAGKDRMDGGAGDDIFEFSVKLSKKNADRIENFQSGEDSLFLSNLIFPNTGEVDAKLSKDNFVIGSEATSSGHRIVYDQDSGKLFFDADGSGGGAKKLFATLDPGTELTHKDFEIF